MHELRKHIVACRAVVVQRLRDGGYTRAVSGQRPGKYIPVTRQQILNNATVERNSRRDVLSMVSVPRCYKQGTRLDPVSERKREERHYVWGGGSKELYFRF
jgi:hypothetical protein